MKQTYFMIIKQDKIVTYHVHIIVNSTFLTNIHHHIDTRTGTSFHNYSITHYLLSTRVIISIDLSN